MAAAPLVLRSLVNGIDKVLLRNEKGMEVTCISLGATVTSIVLPDKTDVLLGYKNLEDYRVNNCYIGSSVGRVANRIGNASFSIEGANYTVSQNIPPHTLHGGVVGFNKANWNVENTTGQNSVTFSHESPDGDMGYPGNVIAKVTYSLTDEGEVVVEYEATTDKATIVNLVNHAYFNLAQQGMIHKHKLQICANHYTPLNSKTLIATGEVEDFSLHPELDFTTPKTVERDMPGDGYDHNYCVSDSTVNHPQYSDLHLCAVLSHGPRELSVYSNQPGMQLYTGKYLEDSPGNREKPGTPPIVPFAGLCLETQAWPNAINYLHDPEVQRQVLLLPGQTYRSKTLWKFKW